MTLGTIDRVRVGWTVCDSTGHKLGTIARIYRPDSLVGEEVMEIRTGFLGLGKRLYAPITAIRAAMQGRVVLAWPRSSFASRRRPVTPVGSPTPTTKVDRRVA